VSDTQKHPKHPLAPPNTLVTRATHPLRAPPIPYTALKLSGNGNECKPLPGGHKDADGVAIILPRREVKGHVGPGSYWSLHLLVLRVDILVS
jgi:hypothetical protein